MFKIMYEMGLDVLKENKMEKFVYIIYKKLIEMKIGDDILGRVFFVVIEILDCGFFGEGIFVIVEYVWVNLLLFFLDGLYYLNVKFVL